MRHVFVIDENVTIAALTYKRPDGTTDRTSARLITVIFANCHGFAISASTFRRWSAQVQQVRSTRQAVNAMLPGMMRQAEVREGKCPRPDDGDPPELTEEQSVEWTTKLHDDRDFIRLAAHFSCFLVTYDAPLLRDIRALKLDTTYGFRVVTPEEAMPFASEPST